MNVAYTRYELIRTFRERRMFIFSLGFPLILYVIVVGSTKDPSKNFDGLRISFPVYYMLGMASFGTMMAMMSSGLRIAGERQAGWTRQLRITPLSPRNYLRTKVLTAYALAALSLAALYLAGAIMGVSLPAETWLKMTGLIAIGLLPLAALGIVLGHLLTVDSTGPATGGIVSLLAVLGGAWFPVHGTLGAIGEYFPSYWLVQAGRVAGHGHGWSGMGWTVVAAWTVVLGALAALAYVRDTGRV
ncbi:MAG: ABC transporter permease [Acidobacteriota bacterium]|nr:ABC transporter permease [Acidobacteriota bacterium]